MPGSRRAIPCACVGLGFALAWLLVATRAEEPQRLLFPPDFARDSAAPPAPTQSSWIRLFSLQPAFPSDPLGLDADDPPGQAPDSGPDWLQLAVGNDNPFFDVRRPGDPGGIGYYRMHTQAKLVDTCETIVSVAVQAVRPAGRDSGGLASGPTAVIPGISWFHSFTNGSAIQGYVGKNLVLGSPDTYRLPHAARYALAVQKPLGDDLPGLNSLFFFVEALGSYRYDMRSIDGPAARWDVLPGLHWKVADNWWLSGGVGMPVQGDGLEHHFWQFTGSFQF